MNLPAMIAAITISVLICLWADRNPPSRIAQVDYCWIDMHVGLKLEGHKTKKGKWIPDQWIPVWTKGWGPCSQEDIYRQI